MPEINLLQDAKTFRAALEQRVAEFQSETLSAIEVGYDCDDRGWIYIHADRRAVHEADGDWTIEMDEDDVVPMEHWVTAREARYEGEPLSVKRVDGSAVALSALDDDEMEHEEADDLPAAIGEMIRSVLFEAQADGLFKPLTDRGPLSLGVEEYSGAWSWPREGEPETVETR
ncbi:MAG: hypothetical protein KGS60_16730 [Verrucomicrobia bacterium]|nr:hypothetical protein [Verrucomicrobiota bacterium]